PFDEALEEGVHLSHRGGAEASHRRRALRGLLRLTRWPAGARPEGRRSRRARDASLKSNGHVASLLRQEAPDEIPWTHLEERRDDALRGSADDADGRASSRVRETFLYDPIALHPEYLRHGRVLEPVLHRPLRLREAGAKRGH